MIRHTLNLILTPQMRLRLGQQPPMLLQNGLIEAPDRQADFVRALVAPEEEAAAFGAEAADAGWCGPEFAKSGL